jgi:DNA-binding protein HU-beta
VLDALVDVGHGELKKTGTFALPGFAKFVAVEKPATEAQQGVNPFTEEPMMIEAKPARKVVNVRLLKVMKDAVSTASNGEGLCLEVRMSADVHHLPPICPACRPMELIHVLSDKQHADAPVRTYRCPVCGTGLVRKSPLHDLSQH